LSVAQFLNSTTDANAAQALANCCAVRAWVDAMLAQRPFASDDAVLLAAADAALPLTEADWLEAFAAHPLIGDIDSLRAKYAATKTLATGEQAGVAMANDATLVELAELNRAYRDKFGFIFIVFATGKTAAEMLAILKSRIGNSREQEVRNAAIEQMKITRLRLQKLGATGVD
jgi:OHCU decarboxylase